MNSSDEKASPPLYEIFPALDLGNLSMVTTTPPLDDEKVPALDLGGAYGYDERVPALDLGGAYGYDERVPALDLGTYGYTPMPMPLRESEIETVDLRRGDGDEEEKKYHQQYQQHYENQQFPGRPAKCSKDVENGVITFTKFWPSSCHEILNGRNCSIFDMLNYVKGKSSNSASATDIYLMKISDNMMRQGMAAATTCQRQMLAHYAKYTFLAKVWISGVGKSENNRLMGDDLYSYNGFRRMWLNHQTKESAGHGYEVMMYRMTTSLVLERRSPHFVPLFAMSYGCKFRDLYDLVVGGNEEMGYNLVNNLRYMFCSLPRRPAIEKSAEDSHDASKKKCNVPFQLLDELEYGVLITPMVGPVITSDSFAQRRSLGTLDDFLSNVPKVWFIQPNSPVYSVLFQVIYSVFILQSEGFNHGDLHFGNILMTSTPITMTAVANKKPSVYVLNLSEDGGGGGGGGDDEHYYLIPGVGYYPLIFDYDFSSSIICPNPKSIIPFTPLLDFAKILNTFMYYIVKRKVRDMWFFGLFVKEHHIEDVKNAIRNKRSLPLQRVVDANTLDDNARILRQISNYYQSPANIVNNVGIPFKLKDGDHAMRMIKRNHLDLYSTWGG